MTQPPRSGPLRRLDARVVPWIAGLLRGIGTGGRRLVTATGAPGRSIGALARRNATLSVAIIAVIVAAGLIYATGGDDHHAVAPAPPDPQVALPGNTLGPTTGDTVATYTAQAAQRRSDLSTSHAATATAIVDFKSYLTAAAALSVVSGLNGVELTGAYARVADLDTAGVHAITLAPISDLSVELTKIANYKRKVVKSYRTHVAAAQTDPTAANRQIVRQYRSVAAEAKVESTAIGANVGCVFALKIVGPPAALIQLAKRPDVRVLDPAPASVPVADLAVVPLEPEVTGVVPVLTYDLTSPATP